MNKAKLKSYAPQARKDFIAAVTARANMLGLSDKAGELEVALACCRRCQIDPSAGIPLTQPKTSRTVADTWVAPIYGGSVKIGSLGQKLIGANRWVTP